MEARSAVLSATTSQTKDTASLLASINRALIDIHHIRYVDPVLYLDFSLIDSTFRSDLTSFTSERLLFGSLSSRKYVSVTVSDKYTQNFSFSFSPPLSFTSYSTMVYLLSGGQLYRMPTETAVLSVPLPSSSLVKAYGGNLYFLDTSTLMIYRSQGNGASFSNPEAWLSDSTYFPDSISSAWAIDGTIWILSSDGVFYRYSAGVIATYFSVHDSLGEAVVPTLFYTDETLPDLYLLDSAHSRVIASSKTGTFMSEYRYDSSLPVTSIFVSSADKTVLLVTPQKIFSFPLE
jgi:hypothetical protein